jgi:hypothetical protein
MSNLLIDEYPLILLPSLAKAIGLNEAIILQQVHYWMRHATHVREGHLWIYKTYAEWQDEFPFWSLDTIGRTIRKLEERGLLISGQFNKWKIDKTKWYRPDYDTITTLQVAMSIPQVATITSLQNATSDMADCNDGGLQLAMTIPETTQEITSETKQRWGWVLTESLMQLDKDVAAEFKDTVPIGISNGVLTVRVKSERHAEQFNARLKKTFDRTANGLFAIVAISQEAVQ